MNKTVTTFSVPPFESLPRSLQREIRRGQREWMLLEKEMWETQGFSVTLKRCGCLRALKPHSEISEWCHKHAPKD